MAQPAPAQHTRAYSPEVSAGQEILDQDPHCGEGFLMNGIVSVERLGDDIQSGHHIRLDRYTMADGYVYERELALATDPRSDTAIGDTTPWLIKKGFNEKVNRILNDMGYHTAFVRPQGDALSATLRDSATNMNSIIEHTLQNSDLRQSILGYGSSRAAAIALGLHNMEYADVIAACFARAPKVEELPATIAQAGFEVLELGKHVLRIGPGGVAGHRETFSSSPSDWLEYIKVIPKLWNGDAGRLSWENQHTPLHMTLFRNDSWSQPSVWKAMEQTRPNMTITMMNGRHMRIPDPKVLAGPFHRFDMLAEMRGFDGEFDQEMLKEVRELQPEPEEEKSLLGRLGLSKALSLVPVKL